MKDITNNFGNYFYPSSALVFYQSQGGYNDTYVEYFDMDDTGAPVNAHPLTAGEAKRLATALNVDEDNLSQLKSDGLLTNNLLSFDAKSATIIWYTKAQSRELFFAEGLGIKSGTAHVPPMVWMADRESLHVYALAINRKPTINTPLHYAPFFNVYEDGKVCMGTVDIKASETGSIRELMMLWENYFFNSYFSHLMADHNPLNGNCVLLWESLVGSDTVFPNKMLVKNNKKLKDILL
jgi:PRTRC genetic system protein B